MANARASPTAARVSTLTSSGETTSDDDDAQDFAFMDPPRYRLRLAISFTYQKESVRLVVVGGEPAEHHTE